MKGETQVNDTDSRGSVRGVRCAPWTAGECQGRQVCTMDCRGLSGTSSVHHGLQGSLRDVRWVPWTPEIEFVRLHMSRFFARLPYGLQGTVRDVRWATWTAGDCQGRQVCTIDCRRRESVRGVHWTTWTAGECQGSQVCKMDWRGLSRGGSLLEILNYLPDGGHDFFLEYQCDFRYRASSNPRYMSGT